jgi:hypothetical protein
MLLHQEVQILQEVGLASKPDHQSILLDDGDLQCWMHSGQEKLRVQLHSSSKLHISTIPHGNSENGLLSTALQLCESWDIKTEKKRKQQWADKLCLQQWDDWI